MNYKIRTAILALHLSLLGTIAGTTAVSAQEPPDDSEEWKIRLPDDPKEALDKTLGTAMKFGTAAGQAFAVAKAALTGDPFAVVNALLDLLGGGGNPGITIEQARTEIIAEINKTRHQELEGSANGQLDVLQMILSNPESMLASVRLAVFVNDTTSLLGQLEIILNDEPAKNAETVVHLLPAYNLLTHALAVGLSMDDPPSVASIENVYRKAISLNEALISDENNGRYGGHLYNYVVGRYGPYDCNRPNYGHDGVADGALECAKCYFSTDDGTWECPAVAPVSAYEGTVEPYYCQGLPNTCDVVTEEHKRFDRDPAAHMVRQSIADHRRAAP